MRRWRWLAILLMLASLISCGSKERPDGVVQIYFLDVGQGDCILLRTDGGDVLVDAGPERDQDLLCIRLEQLGVRELALAIFTHPDEDHIGGADGVLSQASAREVWLSGAPMENESAQRLQSVLDARQITVREVSAGDFCEIGGVKFSVLSPFANSGETDTNASSIVVMADYGETELLLTGDMGVAEEMALLSAYSAAYLDCDIYKVAHHGSNTSSSEALLETITPQYAVISCGADNSYGHPFGEILVRLEKYGATVLRTDLSGEILFETDGQTLRCLADSK